MGCRHAQCHQSLCCCMSSVQVQLSKSSAQASRALASTLWSPFSKVRSPSWTTIDFAMLTSSIGHRCLRQGQGWNETLLESSWTEIQMNAVSIRILHYYCNDNPKPYVIFDLIMSWFDALSVDTLYIRHCHYRSYWVII